LKEVDIETNHRKRNVNRRITQRSWASCYHRGLRNILAHSV